MGSWEAGAMSTHTEDEKLPYAVREFIEREHRSIGECNACDYKPTSQYEIDQATNRITERYRRGKALIATFEPGEEMRCRNYFVQRYDDPYRYRVEKLVEDQVLGQWVLVPAWATCIEEMRKIREAVL
jgi:hypothetical protein